MKLSRLRERKSFSIKVNGTDEQISFQARPLTPADVNAFDSDSKKLPERMAEIISDWDVTDDDGVPLTVNAENLQLIPYSVLIAMQQALFREAYPSDPKGE